ncbi:unnamed protein product [Rhizoctonia solani]|uniref:Uncharacterized protein n=1 Tax=Rhizoctonia solani TaxID=456999 RepID=A0A8H3BJY8_9AGAM|nr:unnamed protein product [Rhizoctonia solani]
MVTSSSLNVTAPRRTGVQTKANKSITNSNTGLSSSRPQPSYARPTESFLKRSSGGTAQRQSARSTASQKKYGQTSESSRGQRKIQAPTDKRPVWNNHFTNPKSFRHPTQSLTTATASSPVPISEELTISAVYPQPPSQLAPIPHPAPNSLSPTHPEHSDPLVLTFPVGLLTPPPSPPSPSQVLKFTSESKYDVFVSSRAYEQDSWSNVDPASIKSKLCKKQFGQCRCGSDICVSDLIKGLDADPGLDDLGCDILGDIFVITAQNPSLFQVALSAYLTT